MGAARKNGPCISQGMAESMTRHYLHDGKKKIITAISSQLDCGCLTLIRSATEAPVFIQAWPRASPIVFTDALLQTHTNTKY